MYNARVQKFVFWITLELCEKAAFLGRNKLLAHNICTPPLLLASIRSLLRPLLRLLFAPKESTPWRHYCWHQALESMSAGTMAPVWKEIKCWSIKDFNGIRVWGFIKMEKNVHLVLHLVLCVSVKVATDSTVLTFHPWCWDHLWAYVVIVVMIVGAMVIVVRIVWAWWWEGRDRGWLRQYFCDELCCWCL